MKNFVHKLFRPIDNAPLIVFRLIFGFIFLYELYYLLKSGWVKRTLIKPSYNFTFFGFEWLNHLMGTYSYVLFGVMMVLAFFVFIGFKYRLNVVLLTLGWACIYLIQKTDYNNYHYLLWLISIIMCFLPAHTYASVDARLRPEIKAYAMPQWISWLLIFQISCVYFYATIAKFYPDWLDGTITKAIYNGREPFPFLKEAFSSQKLFLFTAYAGIIFDGLVIPALLWRKTRWIAIIASLIFHLSNSYLHGLGTFPYFSLSFSIFFFKPEDIRKFFLRSKPVLTDELAQINYKEYRTLFWSFFAPYIVVQTLLPVRHYAIKGDVLWTEEGHRLSWRLMLRYRSGNVRYKVVDKKTNEVLHFRNNELITDFQNKKLAHPDIAFQMAHHIRDHFAKQGKDVAVYAIRSSVSVNGKNTQQMIDPSVDLAATKWNYFGHNEWIRDRKHIDEKPPTVVPMKIQKLHYPLPEKK